MSVALGQCVPPDTAHAISVSLPSWEDNVGYEEGDPRVVNAMVSGYPRFFVHLSIRALAAHCQRKYAIGSEECMLFPTRTIADHCRDFFIHRSIQPRIVELFIDDNHHINIVLFPPHALDIAKQFWQHTGLGISSRLAESCLALLTKHSPSQSTLNNRRYSVKSLTPPKDDTLSSDHHNYVEERYGRNLPISYADSAKRALKRRIAGILIHDDSASTAEVCEPLAGRERVETGPSTRGIEMLTEDDVFLFPSGMAAIWTAHCLLRETRPEGKSVCFGFPYTDTLKILQKWGLGAHFFGNGLDEDIPALEELLASLSSSSSSSTPPILALFTEFPSNPLLRSPNLPKLRLLADKYNFLIVVDETIGNFVNVNVLSYADIVVSSLTKVFSGASNVMGGSLVLNPQAKYYHLLKLHLSKTYLQTISLYPTDTIFLERNSRNFKDRILKINETTFRIVNYLHSRSFDSPPTPSKPKCPAIKSVYYPSLTTSSNYVQCLSPSSQSSQQEPKFGGLFSLTFVSPRASETFFNNLTCYKGPSLGTDFTLACPYTILAHYHELDWAQSYGVEKGLIRVSVGLEEVDLLLRVFEKAVREAEGHVEKERRE